MPKKSAASKLADVSLKALKSYNKTYGKAWDFGANYSSEGTGLEVFFNNELFPKIRETEDVVQDLGNRFNRFYVEVPLIAQLSETYTIADSVPIDINLNKNGLNMLEHHYRKIITKLYGNGEIRKTKFTINNNDMRQRFMTLGDMTKFALRLYQKSISDINLKEEQEVKGMMIDYALNYTKEKRTVTNMKELIKAVNLALLNLQNNSHKYNEADTASGGNVARYTTVSKLNDLYILTTDEVKEELLNTVIANTYNVQGLDISSHIISFDDLGGVYRLTEDVTLTASSLPILNYYGDYESAVGDVLLEGTTFTFDVTSLSDFQGKIEEVKPTTDLFAFVFDIRSLRLRRNTQNMLQPSFYNPENGNTNYWLHYYQQKNISPFYNKIVITGEDEGYVKKVEIVNENPIPVQQIGTATVNVNNQTPVPVTQNGTADVKVTNTTTEPVNTKEVTE